MNLKLPVDIAENYTSGAQRARVMSEHWVKNTIYCPHCGNDLSSFENNRPVADFWCDRCTQEYELKAKKGSVGKKIVDGAYYTMLERLTGNRHPHLMLLVYNRTTLDVHNFYTIPNYFFTPSIIEKRKPLKGAARRTGWIGCNIIVDNIPDIGKIFYVQQGVPKSRQEVLDGWRRTDFVNRVQDIEAKGWLLDILLCVEKLHRQDFTLEDIYKFEDFLKTKHPANHHIQAKIRQQLQFLRDKDVIEFRERGVYRMKR